MSELYAHDAYGNPGAVLTASTARIPAALAEAIADANVLRYAGYAFNAHSGLHCLSKRCYDPATAQFLTKKDPAKADGEESPYQHCAGDPAGKVDPSGEVLRPVAALWRAVVRERPGSEWSLKVPGLKVLVAAKRFAWYLNNARWFMNTARCIVYNDYRHSDPWRWREARNYAESMGVEWGLRQFFRRYEDASYSWFARRYTRDAARMAEILGGGLKVGKLKRWV
ncbi:MAG: RHS repeat-associated core domain-containing protein [Anaerosomatales bacterium]|nr:RHS repeat-associated core domain-containing protein [Anaerosomatales bacterium]